MSHSYHVNKSHFRRLSKNELDELASDPHSLLHQWAEKKVTKNDVLKSRNNRKKVDILRKLNALGA
jgi:ElaB/YqjD/DUF883 family membrane-anchored ribosome-binding protein